MMSTNNPRDSVKSTWPLGDKSQWNLNQRLIHTLNVYPILPGKRVPVHPKTDKTPYFVEWQGHVWVLLHAFAPLLIHQTWLSSTGQGSIHPVAVFLLYFSTFSWSIRDGIPDVGVDKVVSSLWKTTGSRIVMVTCIGYNVSQPPVSVMQDKYWWAWLWLQIGLYGIILDFWFYIYHRAMHDIDALWKYHRTHHLTKHPNSVLTAYADHEQEFFDMIGIPFLTWATFRAFGIPLGFYEWWICHQYIAFTEVLGHTGLRIYGGPPSTLSWLLRLFNVELLIEDHDLHHRKGYRKSHNYGKQTRLWDRLFGTCHERIEMSRQNVDWDRGVYFPIF
ncbi:hypothetical protein ACJZ2D_009698 [Fusarium nematophilum]